MESGQYNAGRIHPCFSSVIESKLRSYNCTITICDPLKRYLQLAANEQTRDEILYLLAAKSDDRQTSMLAVDKHDRNHLVPLPYTVDDMPMFLRRHAIMGSGLTGEIGRAGILAATIPTSLMVPTYIGSTTELTRYLVTDVEKSEEGRRLDPLLKMVLTTIAGGRAECVLCSDLATPNHHELHHAIILGKANRPILEALYDKNTPPAFCQECKIPFANYALGILHSVTSRHGVSCSTCSIFYETPTLSTVESLRHLTTHRLTCPELDCVGIYPTIASLFFHLLASHSHNPRALMFRATTDPETLKKVLRRFSNYPTMATDSYPYNNYFLNNTETSQLITRNLRHPVDIFNLTLHNRRQNISTSTPLQVQAFQTMRVLQREMVNNMERNLIPELTEDQIWAEETRQQEPTEEGPRGHKSWIIVACHALKDIMGTDVKTYHRRNLPLTDINLEVGALTAEDRIIPTRHSSYIELLHVTEDTIDSQNLLVSQHIFISLCKLII